MSTTISDMVPFYNSDQTLIVVKLKWVVLAMTIESDTARYYSSTPYSPYWLSAYNIQLNAGKH